MMSSHLQNRSNLLLWSALFLVIMITLIVQLPVIVDPEMVDEDFRFFYWVFRLTDPDLFTDDPVLGYQMINLELGSVRLLINRVMLGYSLLFTAGSQVMSPILFGKLLVFPLILTSTYYLYQIGTRVTTPFVTFLLCLTFALIVLSPRSGTPLTNALPRSFTLPLLLAMAYYLMIKRYIAASATLVISLIYPPSFLLNVVTYAIVVVVRSIKKRQLELNRRQMIVFVAVLIFCTLFLLPAVTTGLNTAPVGSSHFPDETVINSPLYQQGGRYPLFQEFPFRGNGGFLDSGLIGVSSLVLLFISLFILIVLRGKVQRLPSVFSYLLIASLACYAASWLAIIFAQSAFLHMPNRYTRGVLFIIPLLVVFLNGDAAIKYGARLLATSRGRLVWILPVMGTIAVAAMLFFPSNDNLRMLIVALTLLLFILAIYYRRNQERIRKQAPIIIKPAETNQPTTWWISIFTMLIALSPLLMATHQPNHLMRPSSRIMPLISFLESLPSDIVISGHPCSLNEVPLYAKRTVLFSCETENRDIDLMLSAMDAYYGQTGEEVLRFCRANEVDYLVVETTAFTDDYVKEGDFLFEPINGILSSVIAGRTSFALNEIPDSAKEFQEGSLFVIPCRAEALGVSG